MKSELDVLVVGGYSIADKCDGGTGTRDQIRLTYRGQSVTLGLIKHLVEAEGDLDEAESRYFSDPMLRQFPRQLNTIYLWDFLDRHGFATEAISYYQFERPLFEQYMAARPKVLALSTTFISDPADAIEIARAAKSISPETVVIAGGINVLKSYKQMQLQARGELSGFDPAKLASNSFLCDPSADSGIDAFVVEESGELTLLDIVRAVQNKGDFRSLPNLAFWRGSDLMLTPRLPEPFSFERFPIRWEKVPPQLVGNEIPVRAGVGCPFKCAFCDFSACMSGRVCVTSMM